MSYGVATQTGVSAAIQSIPSMMANKGLRNGYGATFAENFTDGTNVLDPRITFSRASNATVTNSSGLIQYAPHNLLTYSEQFDNAAWTKAETTIIVNSVVAPNNTTTADVLIASAVSAEHTTDQAFTAVAGNTYTVSAYVKANGLTQIGLRFTLGSLWTGGVSPQVRFNLNDGTSVVTTGTPATYSITAEANGWYRIAMSVVCITSGTPSARIQLMSAGNNVFAGNGSNGITVWGAQLNVGSLQPYNPTTVKNLLGYSEAFDNALWTKSNTTISANTTATAAPNGTFTADKLIEDTATTGHLVFTGPAVTNGATYTYSAYLKKGERNFALMALVTAFPTTAIQIDLVNGTVSTGTGTPLNAFCISVGNGWFRCGFSVASTGTAGQCNIYTSANGLWSNRTYTGDGTSGIYIWGAQLSDSASLDTYVNNPVAAPTAAAYYGPRFDYDPVTLQPRGLLIEEQRTNLLTYSEDISNAVWGKGNLTATPNVIVSPDGNTTADAAIENTVASQFHYMNYTVSKAASAIQYTFTAYLKNKGREVAISFSNGSNGVACRVNPATGAITGALGSFGTGWVAGALTMTASGNDWYRVSATFTTDATASFVAQYSTFNTALNTNVYTGDGVSGFYVWGAQLEAGAFATSYIPTTSAQVTRSADIALIQGSNFSGWYNQTEGTISLSALRPSALTGNRTPLAVTDGGFSERITLRTDTATTGTNFVSTASGVQASFFLSNIVSNTPFKTAIAYQLNSVNASMNGVTGTTDTAANIPTVNSMSIGSVLNAEVFNGYIRSLAYYPRRLSNTELQAVTQ